jgi:hypothetical protein
VTLKAEESILLLPVSKKTILKLAVIGFGLWCLVSGCTDLDWMLVENHFDMWNAEKDTWEFSPHLTMGWWDAYMFSLARIIFGVAVTSIVVYREVVK